MNRKKTFNLGDKTLEVLRRGDKPIDIEALDELNGPLNTEEGLQITSFDKVKEVLDTQGYEVIGEREQISNGSFGPLYKIKFKDSSGEEKYLMERCFVRTQAWEKRVEVEGLFRESEPDSQPRFNFFESDKFKNKFIVDYLYNEEIALKRLQGIEGVPAFYGSVDENYLYGSTLQEFVDGYDFASLDKKELDKLGFSLPEIIERLKRTYKQAAKNGFILNDPAGSTIMISKEGGPYIADWYLYSQGHIHNEGPLKELYLKGLKELDDMGKMKLEY
jgi:hypothetical protein